MNSKTLKASIAFLIIGGLLLLVAWLSKSTSGSEFGSNAASDAAFICIAVALLNLIWWIVGGEPIEATLTELRRSVRLLEDSKATGVERIIPVSGEFGSHGEWMERLRAANDQIDLMGYTLHVWTRGQNFAGEVVTRIKKGAKVRILIMDPESSHLESLMNTQQIKAISVDAVRAELKTVLNVFQEIKALLPEDKTAQLEVRTVSKGMIVCQICRTDDEMTVVSYLYSVVASHSPLTSIRGEKSRLFQLYQNEFEQLWMLNPPTQNAE
jgi:hypothetical protein